VEQKSNVQQNDRDHNAGLVLAFLIGIALAVSLGAALDNYAIGVAIGAGVGTSLGIAFSRPKQQSSRALTIAGVVLLLVGIIVLGVVMSLALPHWWCDYPVLSLLPGC
jgi:multidrug transporter EmrE-like cation transporter